MTFTNPTFRKFVCSLLLGASLCGAAPCLASSRDYLAPAGSVAGVVAGAKLGAFVGVVGGPIGSGLGALIGGAIGAVAGDGAGRVVDWVFGD